MPSQPMKRRTGISVRSDQCRTNSMRESRVSWGTRTPFRAPQDLFYLYMFIKQLRDDLVLALELVAQRGDGPLEVALGLGILPLEGRRAVLEELLLPEVEHGGRELMLIAEVR